MHVGGSPDALTRLKNVDFFDVNEFRWGSYFWRSASHAAPHNTFTNSEKWQALATTTYGRSIVKKDWSGWKFGEVSDTTNVSSTLLQLTIPYNADYKVTWEFNATSNTYERSVNQRVDKDYAGISIQANNVVVQFVSTKVVDELGRKDITTIGTGDVLVVRKGILTRGVWKKESKTVRTKFYDKLGNEIVFTPGITWVQVVPKRTVLELTN
jgi:acyl-CoA synthetase (AMP-forming)/AMP-acid ligase II